MLKKESIRLAGAGYAAVSIVANHPGMAGTVSEV